MDNLIQILEEYNIKLGNYHFTKSDRSIKINNTVMYKNICDGLTLGCNYDLKNLENSISQRGIMIDISRGKVYNTEIIKKLIIKSACMGYNYMMIYMEDLIELEDYPQYGYLRGRLGDDQIKEIVEFAQKLDYKIIPAIQTLGHLEHFLQWDVSNSVKGTELSLDPLKSESYKFLDKLIERVTTLFGAESINVGLDEVFDLGFNNINSMKIDQRKLFVDHLDKVVEICKKYNIQNIKMWSDMLFSVYSNTDGSQLYSTDLKQKVEQIDPNVELVYWNYWTRDTKQLSDVLAVHKQYSSKISMAGAIHTAMNIFYDETMLEATQASVSACVEHQIDDMLFTMWSGDGAICSIDTMFFGMYETMRILFNTEQSSESYEGITGNSYCVLKQICNLKSLGLNPTAILWNDPIYDMYYKSVPEDEVILYYNCVKQVERLPETTELNKYYNTLLDYLELDSYRYINNSLEPKLIDMITKLYCQIAEHIEKMWFCEAKLYGIEEIQKRFALKISRYNISRSHPDYMFSEDIEQLEGHIKPTFNQLYGPNKWRY